ncbi:KOW domain-containing RNA-binding protein [Clostridiaceae bacterium HSG29]|nr:KOW domain-containing RNA-binding protein [Clostridiaceae bacterium HSG29]
MNDISQVIEGQYVKSIKGRDKNYIFIVTEIVDDKHVKLVDGDLRKVNNPKVKNIKHLQIINKISTTIQEVLISNKKLSDFMINQEIIKLRLSDTK